MKLVTYVIYSSLKASGFLNKIILRVLIPIQILSSVTPSATNNSINFRTIYSRSSKGVNSVIDSAIKAKSLAAYFISGLINLIIIE